MDEQYILYNILSVYTLEITLSEQHTDSFHGYLSLSGCLLPENIDYIKWMGKYDFSNY